MGEVRVKARVEARDVARGSMPWVVGSVVGVATSGVYRRRWQWARPSSTALAASWIRGEVVEWGRREEAGTASSQQR